MDEKVLEVLNDILRVQTKQNELLNKHLTRLRYGMRTIFAVMTLLCIVLGWWSWKERNSASITTASSRAYLAAEQKRVLQRVQAEEKDKLMKLRAAVEDAAPATVKEEVR